MGVLLHFIVSLSDGQIILALLDVSSPLVHEGQQQVADDLICKGTLWV